MLAARGALDVIVDYPLGKFAFGVPLWRNQLDLKDVLEHESALIQLYCSRISDLRDTILFDCGADIGIFTAGVCAHSDAITSVIALEPNPDALPILQRNMAALPFAARAVASAVADFTGSGKLESPAYDSDYTARFLVPGDGPIDVTTLDSFERFAGNVAIKIDVEGGEMEVLRGAGETIRSSACCVIALEAHPLVVKRTGRDPVECLRFLSSIRPFRFTVSETREDLPLDRAVVRPGQTGVLNIVCASL